MENKELTFKQQKACYLISSGLNMKDVAAVVGTTEQSLFRWLKLSNFQTELRSLKRIIAERSLGKLQLLNDKAIQTLERLLTCGNSPTECRSACAIISQNQSSITFFEYSERIRAIESRLDETT
jgi:hypothetical protein